MVETVQGCLQVLEYLVAAAWYQTVEAMVETAEGCLEVQVLEALESVVTAAAVELSSVLVMLEDLSCS